MLGEPTTDRRALRRAATKAEILEAAWDMCRADGLAALSLRDLAKRVGMQAPSLYGYFDSKNAIYDAMFAQGMAEFAAGQEDLDGVSFADGIGIGMRYFVEFCVADPARYQLLFQRTIPGFEPSPEAYEISVASLQRFVDWFGTHGRDMDDVDLYTAVASGLVAQQVSNEPGGDRWTRRIDDAVDMVVAHTKKRGKK